MKLALALAALLLAAACGSEGAGTATTTTATAPESWPTAVPAAPAAVTTRGIATVMDIGSPELCLGAVAESWPPQCSGPAIEGWDWSRHKGMYESQQGTRWGQFVVTGTWDGTTMSVESAVPAPLYDAMAEEPPALPTPAVEHTPAELDEIADEVVSDLPGAQGASTRDGHVQVDVTYDDGSLQAWVDETYGDDVVVVTSMLQDVQD
ncbi:MAG: hypothetical protein WBP61_19150 [Nocardioides sp.]